MKMVIVNNELEYIEHGNGERVLVRSIRSHTPVKVRFRNATRRRVALLWRNYAGRRTTYAVLPSLAYIDIDTFVSHPWYFEDELTKERYVVNNKKIFYPPPNQSPQHRTIWNITISVRSLRHTALLAIALLLKDPDHVTQLELPASLAELLRNLVTLNQTPAVPETDSQ